MKKPFVIDKKIEDALNSLEGLEKASPGPFFYTRLQARLHRAEANVWEAIIAFVARPSVAIASIILVIAVNTFVLFRDASGPASYAVQSDQAFIDEYNQTVSFYNVENMEP
jgi:hypothetical protein